MLLEIIELTHSNAAGFSLKESGISKLYNYANEKLKNINFNEGFYEADFIVNSNCSYLTQMIFELWEGRRIYGQDCDEPIIVVENLNISSQNMQVMGSNKDTLKITVNGISYMKFKAKELIEELKQYGTAKFIATIVGRGNVNTWMGNKTPQIFIDEIETKKLTNYDF